MAKRSRLREFQESLAARLASARQGAPASGLLGVESGTQRWLVDLADSGEVVPLTVLAPVPLTRPWFAGVANVRGALYSVVDFAVFCGQAATPHQAETRLLLIGTRHGINSALLVDRTLGLKNLAEMTPEPAGDAGPAWAGATCSDAQGRRWQRLDVAALLADARFLDVGSASSTGE